MFCGKKRQKWQEKKEKFSYQTTYANIYVFGSPNSTNQCKLIWVWKCYYCISYFFFSPRLSFLNTLYRDDIMHMAWKKYCNYKNIMFGKTQKERAISDRVCSLGTFVMAVYGERCSMGHRGTLLQYRNRPLGQTSPNISSPHNTSMSWPGHKYRRQGINCTIAIYTHCTAVPVIIVINGDFHITSFDILISPWSSSSENLLLTFCPSLHWSIQFYYFEFSPKRAISPLEF